MTQESSDLQIDNQASGGWKTDGMLPISSIRERALIRILAIAERRNLDPTPLIQGLANDFPGLHGQKLMRLAFTISAGTPAVDAVRRVSGLLNPSTVMALRLGRDSSRLQEMYDALLDAWSLPENELANAGRAEASDIARTAITFFVGASVIAFMMIFIVPTFETMFEEFGLQLPDSTVLLIDCARFFGGMSNLIIPALICYLMFRHRTVRMLLERLLFPLGLASPSVPASLGLRSLLAIIAQSGRPLVAGLSTLADHHDKPSIRNRLKKVCERIKLGQKTWGSLADERLISRREADALSTSESPQSQAWLLGWFVATRRKRYFNRARMTCRTISFMGTFVLAGLVAWTVIALFMPLVELIAGMS